MAPPHDPTEVVEDYKAALAIDQKLKDTISNRDAVKTGSITT